MTGGVMSRGKAVWRETALRRHPRALENTSHSLAALTLPVLSDPYTARGQQHQRTTALEMRHNQLPSSVKHWLPWRLLIFEVSMLRSSPPSIVGERCTGRPATTTWPGRCTPGHKDPRTWYLVFSTFVILNLCRMIWMDTDVLHALFAVIERTACLSKLPVEGNYCTRHGLPSRLAEMWPASGSAIGSRVQFVGQVGNIAGDATSFVTLVLRLV